MPPESICSHSNFWRFIYEEQKKRRIEKLVLLPGASSYGSAKHAVNRLAEFVNSDHGEQGVKCFAIHPGGVKTDLANKMPEEFHSALVDAPELPAGFAVWLSSGKRTGQREDI